MWIVCQDKRSVINADNTIGIAVSDNFVIAKTIDNAQIVLGLYKSDERANDVFLGMLKDVFPKEVVAIQNAVVSDSLTEMFERNSIDCLYVKTDNPEVRIDRIEPRVYYMPEE